MAGRIDRLFQRGGQPARVTVEGLFAQNIMGHFQQLFRRERLGNETVGLETLQGFLHFFF
jgi:hypothetical protein